MITKPEKFKALRSTLRWRFTLCNASGLEAYVKIPPMKAQYRLQVITWVEDDGDRSLNHVSTTRMQFIFHIWSFFFSFLFYLLIYLFTLNHHILRSFSSRHYTHRCHFPDLKPTFFRYPVAMFVSLGSLLSRINYLIIINSTNYI